MAAVGRALIVINAVVELAQVPLLYVYVTVYVPVVLLEGVIAPVPAFIVKPVVEE